MSDISLGIEAGCCGVVAGEGVYSGGASSYDETSNVADVGLVMFLGFRVDGRLTIAAGVWVGVSNVPRRRWLLFRAT